MLETRVSVRKMQMLVREQTAVILILSCITTGVVCVVQSGRPGRKAK